MAVNTLSKQAHSAPIGIFAVDHGPELQDFAAMVGDVLQLPYELLVLEDGQNVSDRPLVMIDCACYQPGRIQSWLKSLQGNIPPTALYNTEPSSLHESLLEWPCVRGLFFHDTDEQQFADGLRLLLEGDFWVPRRLLHAYLERNRRPPTHNLKAPEMLTKREREILILLEKGATNAAMAKAMEVSEHTIKTHLYNIYKKIDVANRIEAINWSRQNISADELSD